MKIALVGYGKMGKTIESLAKERGHEIVYIGSSSFDIQELKASGAEVAIEFTAPESAYDNLSKLNASAIPTVSGTTGWLEKYDEIVKICNQSKGAFIYGSNFSLGVNLFFELNSRLAKLMANYTNEYDISMVEVHHTQKLDAPSGTAISIAEGVMNEISSKKEWVLKQEGKTSSDSQIEIEALREDPVPGTHSVTYGSEIDDIEIKHTAHTRKGFALGAVIAAEWLVGKEGVFTMKDVLGL